mmetsp:Transcript_29900/g.85668  ORF Transcript_29900/g.85668 Transcript_29900/m.85668 type:complete len:270 (+) Transcript_29900:106-915(+)
MVLSPELLSYAENIWQHFPEEFLTLGAADFGNEFQVGKHLQRQMVTTESAVIIHIVIHRQHSAQLEGPPFPRFVERTTADASSGAQQHRPPRAPGWSSEAQDLRSEAQGLHSCRQPCLAEVFNTPRLTEVFNSTKRPKAAASAPKHTDPPSCQREAAGRARKHPEPLYRHCQGTHTTQACTEAVPSKATRSPSGTTLSSDSMDSPFGQHVAWTRQCTASSSWSDAPSAVAMRRGMDDLAHVVTRPPPAPSTAVIRAPGLDRLGSELGRG